MPFKGKLCFSREVASRVKNLYKEAPISSLVVEKTEDTFILWPIRLIRSENNDQQRGLITIAGKTVFRAV